MAELSSAVRELTKGKKASENLMIYTKELSALYSNISHLRLAINYYTFSEIYYELGKDKREIISNEIENIQQLVKDVMLNEEPDFKKSEEVIVKLRSDIIDKMEILTAFTDRIQIYEYILNRVEYRFNESEYDENYYRNNFEKDIYNYVINDRDNAVINMKLAMVMGELPMRLSKNKFFDILKDSFSIYKESEKGSVADFAYRLKTAGGIYTPEGMDKYFIQLNKYLEDFASVDYSEITNEQFEQLRSEMDTAGELVREYADTFVLITEIINDIYSIVLCGGLVYDNNKDKLTDIISASKEVIDGGTEPDLELAEQFVMFEGVQERLGMMISGPESAMDKIFEINEKVIEHIGMTENFKKLDKISKLQSTSTFATLEEDSALREQADDKYVKKVVDELMADFANVFENNARYYNRAVMAAVISNVPAYFNNLEEFKSYVHVALTQCSDVAEQKACMTLINMMIASE